MIAGVWDSASGASPKFYYLVNTDGSLSTVFLRQEQYCVRKVIKKKVEYVPVNPQPEKTKIVVIHRYYTASKLDKTYKKRVTWLGDGGLQSSLAVVEYLGKFPGLAPHGKGHSKSNEYVRTNKEVFQNIDEMTDKVKPHKIYNHLKNDFEDVTGPTGRKQIYNRQYYKRVQSNKTNGHSNNVADQIIQLENMVSEGHPFIKSVIRNSGKPPSILLYTDEQLADIKNFCCSGQTVLGVDKTFMLCKMHVTVTCYKQLTVTRSSTGKNPICIGPMFIHDCSAYETYTEFFQHLRLRLPCANFGKLVIGSDDERALVKAITATFPESTHILCTRHLEQNAKHKMTDVGIGMKKRKEMMKNIFGQEGIVSADDTVCFDERCNDFETQYSSTSGPFLEYFRKHLKANLQTKVNEPSRKAPLCQNWMNNNCESINHLLKQTVDWKSKGLTEFAKLAYDLVIGQFKEVKRALLGIGEFRLAPTHGQFKVSKTEWLAMTVTQRSNLYKKFRSYKTNKSLVNSTNGRCTVVEPRTNGKKPGTRKRKVNIKTRTSKKVKVQHQASIVSP